MKIAAIKAQTDLLCAAGDYVAAYEKANSYKEEGLVLSKKEGGEWAVTNLPAAYHPLIRNAMREYSGAAGIVYDDALAKRYAGYMIQRIRQ